VIQHTINDNGKQTNFQILKIYTTIYGEKKDGLIANNAVSGPDSLACSDPYEPALAKASSKGIFTSSSNKDIVNRQLDAIILAVKPNSILKACDDIRQYTQQQQQQQQQQKDDDLPVIISIAAGITLDTLEKALPDRQVIRVMPNTPCLVGMAASGYCMGTHATNDSKCEMLVQTIFGSVGTVLKIEPEYLLNSVTGLSGSGPAYVFEFIEALADGGVRVGLSRTDSIILAAQTVKGAAEMILQTKQHPGVLKDQVCSPGGTTIAGVDSLEQGSFRSTVIQAVKSATRRSLVLGGTSTEEIHTKFNL
jgi:pyrroline-5-carboxylate reductase